MRARPLALALIAATLLTALACSPGRQATSGARPGAAADTLHFTGTALDGGAFEGSQLTGKPTILWFWEPACAKCRAQSPETVMTADLYEGQINVVGIAGAGGSAHLNEFVSSTGTRQLRHLADPERRIWQRFGATRPGTYALLDATGKVLARNADLDGRLAKEAAPLVGRPTK